MSFRQISFYHKGQGWDLKCLGSMPTFGRFYPTYREDYRAGSPCDPL